MMNRRQFLSTVLGGSAVFVLPAGMIAAESIIPSAEAATTLGGAETIVTNETIRNLEAMVARTNGFSWWAHNELRHEYLSISERLSRVHADTLLTHSIMDGYILHTLSDWHLMHNEGDYNPQRAIDVLLDNAERYADLPALRGACIVKAAQTAQFLGETTRARQLYARVPKGTPYWNIARDFLTNTL